MAGGSGAAGLLDSVERFSVETQSWALLDLRLPHRLEDLSLLCLRPEELLIFGGQNPEIEKQFAYKVDVARRNAFLLCELAGEHIDKACLHKNKVLCFGVG